MESNDLFTTDGATLFAPLQDALQAYEADGGELRDFGDRCRQTSDLLREIGEDEAAVLTQTLGLLSEVLSADDQDPDTDGQACQQVIDFLRRGLETLSSGLSSDGGGAAAPIAELLEQAEQQWGGPLQWLRDTDPLAEPAGEPADEWDEAPAGAGGQVGLILSALGGAIDGAGTSAADSVEPPRRPAAPPGPAFQGAPFAARPAATSVPQAAAGGLDAELLEAYLEDANQCLASMERAVLEFENDPTSEDPVLQLCRELHTLKGASASVGFNDLAAQLHDVEEQLERQLSESAQVPADLVMNCVDAVRAQIAKLQPGPASADGATPTAAGPAIAGDSADVNTLRVRTAQLDRLMDLLADVVVWRSRREERLSELDTSGDELSRCVFRLQAMEDRLRDRGHRGHNAADSATQTTSYVTELSNDMREIARQLSQTRQQVADENRAVSQFIQEFRQELVQIRRVPLTGLFQRLHRSIREAARIEGREVRLEIHGEQTGLERSLQEKLYEPLLHLVRNAVSHGIESPEERVRAGKSPAGTVTLDAYGSPHVLIIEVRDDGKGLDYDAIRRRGLERGLLHADRPVSRAELARLIFRPGFSTRQTTNEVSGRGVGMNVVEEALDRCQCHIETESEPGCGTRFRLTIPLRSVIEHTLICRCGGQSFALPMQFVKSASQDSDAVPTSGDTAHRLADLLRLPAGETSRRQHWIEIADRLASKLTANAAQRLTDEHRICLGVDEILGPEEVVVRPLPPLLRQHPHLCGLTLSGAGEVVLLLDGRRLLMDAVAEGEAGKSLVAAPASGTVPRPEQQDEVQVLVVDDSLSARRRLVQKLLALGMGITEAADGVEAVDLLRSRTFDAVFSDLEMPRLGGFDLLAEMSSLPAAPPCVIVTTRIEPQIQERARTLGAAGFLPKPVETAAVQDMLVRLQLTTRVSQTGDE